jgi:hypothetical protein
MKKSLDITGRKFNKLTVIKFVKHDKWYQQLWLCKCECGRQKLMIKKPVMSGRSKSCGCGMGVTHGMSQTKKGNSVAVKKFYIAWAQMKQRCANRKATNYKDYGGRGIKFCKRWELFENFRDDMYELFKKHFVKYGSRQTSLDRVNNSKGYFPSNCKWSTSSQQALNRRARVYL